MKNIKVAAILFALIVLQVFTMRAEAQETYKILAEGQYSQVESPFIFVARDALTFNQLQALVPELAKAQSPDFKKNAVVAAFAGSRNTGGFSVVMKKVGSGLTVDMLSPKKDSVVTQVITTPFKVALVPVEEGKALVMDVSAVWKAQMKQFTLTKGDFEFSGGFAPRRRQFKAGGKLSMLSYDNYVTVGFELQGTGNAKMRRLKEFASGEIKNEMIKLSRLDAGNFTDAPRPPLRVEGKIVGKKLSMKFDPHTSTVADGYSARGALEAAMVN